jgi:pilus assembly protein CpaB
MKLSIVGLLVLGLFAALSAAVLMALLTVRKNGSEIVVEPEVTVLVATRDIAPNTLIDGAAVAEQKVPRAKVPEQALSASVQAIGKVTALPVLKGQAFRRDVFVTEGSGPQLAASFPPGKRAVAISLSDAAGLDGVLYPGSVVDIILTVKSGMANEPGRSRTVLEAVPVLAIERQTVIAKDAEKQDGGSGKNSNSRRVTLLVNSTQAAVVQLAMNEGTLSLAMRNPLDKNVADRNQIDLQQIMPKKENGASFMEVLAMTLAKAAAARAAAPAPAPAPEPATAASAPAAAPPVTLAPAKPKPAWETIIIRGGAVEKVEFPDSPELRELAQKNAKF